MAKTVKILAAIIIGLILVLAIAVFVITRLIDPNDFKPEISAAARDNANLDLTINGNLAWTFWPSLGVQIGHTEARLVDDEELFAGIDSAHLGVALWPLFSGKVEMDEIRIQALTLNLIEGPNGPNWERIAASETPEAETPDAAAEAESSGIDIPLSIPSIVISDANVRYRVLADGTDIVVEHANISAQNVSLDQPFPLQASLRYQDQSDIRIDTSIDTVLAMNLDKNIFKLSPLTIDADIGGVTITPLSVHTQMNVEAALDEDRVSVRELVLEAAGTRTSGGVDINQLSGKMIFAGEIKTAPFDANAALKSIGEAPIETSDANALKSVSLEAKLTGPENSIMLNPLTIKLDSSTIQGSAGLADIDSGKIVFNLSLDKLVADGYMPPDTGVAEESVVASNASTGILPPLSDETLLPLEDLRTLIIDGKLHVGSVSLMDIQASEMDFVVKANQGLMQLTQAQGKALGGTFSATASLDARTDTPVMTLSKKVTHVQVQPVATMALEDDLFTGILDMTLDFSSKGNSEKALVENAKGSTTFKLVDGTVRGANLHNTLVGGINDMLGAYKQLAEFIPGQESGKLPLELSEDTKIIDLTGAAHLEKEIAYVDKLDAKLNRGAVDGAGHLNLRSEEFDFQLSMQSPDISDSKYLKDQVWPLHCEGNLEGSAADWCRPDKDGFKKIGKDVAAKAAADKIKEKYGIESDGDTAEEVIKDAAKQKANEEVKKQLNDKLNKLFK